MARLRAFDPVDMRNFSSSVGTVTYADAKTFVVTGGASDTYYIGSFSYPGGDWRGTINAIASYSFNQLDWQVDGISLPTRYLVVGASLKDTYKVAFAGGDSIIGSRFSDRLDGYGGNDWLAGGRGADVLFGGFGNDRLAGGNGWDLLTGGPGRDTFVFDARDGRDVIRDFSNGVDRIEVSSGAERFGQLEISRVQGGTIVSFGDTDVFLAGINRQQLDAGDFIFS